MFELRHFLEGEEMEGTRVLSEQWSLFRYWFHAMSGSFPGLFVRARLHIVGVYYTIVAGIDDHFFSLLATHFSLTLLHDRPPPCL